MNMSRRSRPGSRCRSGANFCRTGRTTSVNTCSQLGTRWMPPTPERFGSTKLSESFHIGQALEGVDDGEGDDVEVGGLVGHDGQGAQEDVDGFLLPVARVNEFAVARFNRDDCGQLPDLLRRQAVKQLAHTAVEAQALEA